MLVLSRRTEEQIIIGDDIKITVLAIKGKSVKLGVQAGSELKIMRAELLAAPEEPAEHPATRIADPTAGIVEAPSVDESDPHPQGVSDDLSVPAWSPNRPAWLAICCCS